MNRMKELQEVYNRLLDNIVDEGFDLDCGKVVPADGRACIPNDDCWFCGEPIREEELYVDIEVNRAGVDKIELFHRGHLRCVLMKHDSLVELEVLENIYGKDVVSFLSDEQYDLMRFRQYWKEFREMYQTFVWNVVQGEKTDKQHACLGDGVVEIWNGSSQRLKEIICLKAEKAVEDMGSSFDDIEETLRG